MMIYYRISGTFFYLYKQSLSFNGFIAWVIYGGNKTEALNKSDHGDIVNAGDIVPIIGDFSRRIHLDVIRNLFVYLKEKYYRWPH